MWNESEDTETAVMKEHVRSRLSEKSKKLLLLKRTGYRNGRANVQERSMWTA